MCVSGVAIGMANMKTVLLLIRKVLLPAGIGCIEEAVGTVGRLGSAVQQAEIAMSLALVAKLSVSDWLCQNNYTRLHRLQTQ